MNSYSALHDVDWTFSDARTHGATHRAHPYPAKFIPQIPRTLIELLHPGDGSGVMDPFCGSGTTLVEAALAGHPAVGIDVNPLSCLISKVKVTPLSRGLGIAAQAAVEQALSMRMEPPPIPGLDHWFQRDVQLELASLTNAIDLQSDEDVRDALRVSLSSIIVRVSNQESDTRYAAIDKQIDPKEVARLFLEAAIGLDDALTSTWGGLFSPPSVTVINQDVLSVEPRQVPGPISLAITSPPYPNAYEYWLYHKYRMYWLGMDPVSVKEREIGARPHFFKKDPHTANDFGNQIGTVMSLLSQAIVPGGHACVLVGDSVIRGELVDNAAIVRRAAEVAGFEETALLGREIPATRKAFNPKHGRIKKERILVFRRASG